MALVRAFLSFDPPPSIISHLGAFQQRLRHSIPGVAWAPPAQFHSTISFLGNVDETLLRAILREVSEAVRSAPSFGISYEGLGRFPETGPPEILWAGCVNADGRLLALKKSLDDAVRRSGIESAPGPFHPHVTLGRVRTTQRRVVTR